MHVIAPIGYLSSSRGGTEIYALNVLSLLHKRGHDISVLYEKEGDQLEEYRNICSQLVRVKSFKLNPSFLRDIVGISSEHNAVVYSNQYDNLFFSLALSLVYGLPLVSHIQLEAPLEYTWVRKLKQRYTFSQVNKFIATSEAVKQDWSLKLGIKEENISVIYNGINLEHFSPAKDLVKSRLHWGVDENAKIISYVGRLEDYKGVHVLIKAFSLLVKDYKIGNLKLFIAGKSLVSGDGYENYLKQLVSDLGLTSDVIFWGHVSDPEKVYQISDVLVVPSLWLEAFGLVTVEAMACGIPVVGSRAGAIPEILNEQFGSYLCEPNDAEDLKQKLANLLRWREQDPDLGIRCRKHVEDKFDLGKKVAEIEDIFSHLMSKRR